MFRRRDQKNKLTTPSVVSSDQRRDAAVAAIAIGVGFTDRVKAHNAALEGLATDLSEGQIRRLTSPEMVWYRNYIVGECARIATEATTLKDGFINSHTPSAAETTSRLETLASEHQVLLDDSLVNYREVAAGKLEPTDLLRAIREAQEQLGGPEPTQ